MERCLGNIWNIMRSYYLSQVLASGCFPGITLPAGDVVALALMGVALLLCAPVFMSLVVIASLCKICPLSSAPERD